jgi:hypothetical protein
LNRPWFYRFFAGFGAGFFCAGFDGLDAGALPAFEFVAKAGFPFAEADFPGAALATTLACDLGCA